MRGSGDFRLPASLLALIFMIGAGLAVAGLSIEQTQAGYEWFARHPLTTNLWSSIIGFCTVTFVVGVGFNAVGGRSDRARRENQIRAVVARELTTYLDPGVGARNIMSTHVEGAAHRIRHSGRPIRLSAGQDLEEAEHLLAIHIRPYVDRHLDPRARFTRFSVLGEELIDASRFLMDMERQITAAARAHSSGQTGMNGPISNFYLDVAKLMGKFRTR
ncbi:hypothetical protein AB0F81_21210 [Actinoplanes sp. NPDC024001]|uniref:hypothetical protein n=1 Tax=Actinoplanes sp. NPDC024001 TaxID=3154598 RepID=UPI0033C5DA76